MRCRSIYKMHMKILSNIFALVMLIEFSLAAATNPVVSERVINADFTAMQGPLNTMFKRCVGAGRANEGLRADWQRQLADRKSVV